MFFRQRGFQNITPEQLGERLCDRQDDFLLLDVRTPQEHAAQAIEGSYLLPVQELQFRASELPKNKEIIVYCRVGNRSAFASEFLSRLGYRVKNLEGGILAWEQTQQVCGNA
jgi:rhodanese-related sulfurtransferase